MWENIPKKDHDSFDNKIIPKQAMKILQVLITYIQAEKLSIDEGRQKQTLI